MAFSFLEIHFYPQKNQHGILFLSFDYHKDKSSREFFSLYWENGNLLIDLFWFHIVDIYPRYWLDKILGL